MRHWLCKGALDMQKQPKGPKGKCMAEQKEPKGKQQKQKINKNEVSSQSEQYIIPKHLGRPHEHRKPEVLEKTVAVAVEVIVVLLVIVAADS